MIGLSNNDYQAECWKYAKSANRPWTLSWRIFYDKMVGRVCINKDELELVLIYGLSKN